MTGTASTVDQGHGEATPPSTVDKGPAETAPTTEFAKRNVYLAAIVPDALENAVDLLMPDRLEALLDRGAGKVTRECPPASAIDHFCTTTVMTE